MSKTQVELIGLKAAVKSIPDGLLAKLGIESTDTPITETLDEWVNVRHQISVLEAKRREIEPMATCQLRDLLEAQGKERGKGYEVGGHMVCLKVRKIKPKEEEIDGLEAINHEIEVESKRFHKQPEVMEIVMQIEALQATLTALQKDYEELLIQDSRIATLVKEREELIQSVTKKVEVLELRQIKK